MAAQQDSDPFVVAAADLRAAGNEVTQRGIAEVAARQAFDIAIRQMQSLLNTSNASQAEAEARKQRCKDAMDQLEDCETRLRVAEDRQRVATSVVYKLNIYLRLPPQPPIPAPAQAPVPVPAPVPAAAQAPARPPAQAWTPAQPRK